MELEERTCVCGCGGKFRVMPSSDAVFSSKECELYYLDSKNADVTRTGWRRWRSVKGREEVQAAIAKVKGLN